MAHQPEPSTIDILDKESLDLARCERMVDLIDDQLADVERLRSQLADMRAQWMLRLAAARDARPDHRRRRAPRGTLRASLVSQLQAAAKPLSMDQLVDRLLVERPRFNPRSIGVILARLKEAGLVESENALWRWKR